MGVFFQKGSTLSQKVVGSVLMAMFVGPAFMIFTHNFVSSLWVSKFSFYLSLVFTGFSIVVLIYLYVKKLWRPAAAWYSFSKLKRLLVVPAMPFLLFGVIWINLAISLPQLYTLVFGDPAVKPDVVIKDSYHSKRSCDYRLEPQSINAIFFHYCISEGLYNYLPDEEVKAELLVRKSSLGFMVEDIRLLNNKR